MNKLLKCITLLCSSAVAATAQTTTVIEQWDFTANSLIGVNGSSTTYFNGAGNVDETGGAKDDTYTVNRPGGFSGDVLSGLDINSSSTDTVTIQFTMASWDLSHASGAAFGIRLRSSAKQNVMVLQAVQNVTATSESVIRVQGFHYDGTTVGKFIQGGLATPGWTGSSSITIGLTFDLVNETYTFWIGDPDTDDGSGWYNRFNSYTGSAPGIASVTIDTQDWQLSPFSGIGDNTSGDFIELDQVIISTSKTLDGYQITISNVQASGGNLVIDFSGTPDTAWTVWASSTLSAFSDVTGVSTLVEEPAGVYNATIPLSGSAYFVQFEFP